MSFGLLCFELLMPFHATCFLSSRKIGPDSHYNEFFILSPNFLLALLSASFIILLTTVSLNCRYFFQYLSFLFATFTLSVHQLGVFIFLFRLLCTQQLSCTSSNIIFVISLQLSSTTLFFLLSNFSFTVFLNFSLHISIFLSLLHLIYLLEIFLLISSSFFYIFLNSTINRKWSLPIYGSLLTYSLHSQYFFIIPWLSKSYQ